MQRRGLCATQRPLCNFIRQPRILPLPGCLSQKCIAQCRLALRQAQGERKRQIPFVLSGLREALVEARVYLSSRLMRQPPGERVGVRGILHRSIILSRTPLGYAKVSVRESTNRGVLLLTHNPITVPVARRVGNYLNWESTSLAPYFPARVPHQPPLPPHSFHTRLGSQWAPALPWG